MKHFKYFLGTYTVTDQEFILLLLLQSALQPLVGFRPAQLWLSILSREVLQSAVCQRHVQLPTWRRTRDLERFNFRHKRPPAPEATLANPAAEGGTVGEKWPRNFAESGDFTSLLGSFTCRKARHGTGGLNFPSEGRRAEDFFRPKNPTASAYQEFISNI
jgi:hypothetical protein